MAHGYKVRLITSGLKLCETLPQITYFSLFSILHNQPFQNEKKLFLQTFMKHAHLFSI